MATVDKSKLLSRRLTEGEKEIEGLGTFRFVALSRKQVLDLGNQYGGNGQSTGEMDLALTEQKILAAALIDPVMSEEEIAQWQENSDASEINDLFMAVLDLSGMSAETGGKQVVKEAMRRFP